MVQTMSILWTRQPVFKTTKIETFIYYGEQVITMQVQNIIAIVIIASIICGIGGYVGAGYIHDQQVRSLIAPELQNNSIAYEIAEQYGVPVLYEELGQDSNNYTVRGQSRFYSSNGQLAEIVLDDDVDPNSQDAYAILAHEEGHAYLNANGLENNEEAADNFAASKGYNIVDAYHGIH